MMPAFAQLSGASSDATRPVREKSPSTGWYT